MEGVRTERRPPEPAPTLFNSTIETGIRAVIVLEAMYPRACGLAEMTCFDHLVVHSADVDGPPSLHPDLQPRTGELVVRRGLVGESLRLMCQMQLVDETHDEHGIRYQASDGVPSFLRPMRAPYTLALRERAKWLADELRDRTEAEIEDLANALVSRWTLGPRPGGDGQDGGDPR